MSKLYLGEKGNVKEVLYANGNAFSGKDNPKHVRWVVRISKNCGDYHVPCDKNLHVETAVTVGERSGASASVVIRIIKFRENMNSDIIVRAVDPCNWVVSEDDYLMLIHGSPCLPRKYLVEKGILMGTSVKANSIKSLCQDLLIATRVPVCYTYETPTPRIEGKLPGSGLPGSVGKKEKTLTEKIFDALDRL